MPAVVAWFNSAASISLAIVLVAAGCAKFIWPQELEVILYRALPTPLWRERVLTTRALVRIIAGGETLLALGLITLGSGAGRVLALLTSVIFGAFIYVVWWASGRGLSCGCFGKLSSGPADKSEFARNVSLFAISGGLAASRFLRPDAHLTLNGQAITGAVAIIALTIAVTILASRREPPTEQPSSDAPHAPLKRATLRSVPPTHRVTRRQVLKQGTAAAVLAVGGMLLPASVKRVLACWTWLQPNYNVVPTYTWYPMWVDYDTGLPAGLWTTIYWGDGTSSAGYASGHEFSAWNYIVSEGTYYPQAYVGGCWDTSTTYVQNNPTQICFKKLSHCQQCCTNYRYGRPCTDCCSSCFYGCYWGGTPCSAGDCAGCWINVV